MYYQNIHGLLWKEQNGKSEWLWDYAIIEKGKHTPSVFDGKILVPFAVESSFVGSWLKQ